MELFHSGLVAAIAVLVAINGYQLYKLDKRVKNLENRKVDTDH